MAYRILSAIRKDGQKNRILQRDRGLFVPLGPPPPLKRAYDEEGTWADAVSSYRSSTFSTA